MRNNKGMSLVEVMVATGMLGVLTMYIASNNKFMTKSMKNYDTGVAITDFNRSVMKILNHPASCNATINQNSGLFNNVFSSSNGTRTDASAFTFISVQGDDISGAQSTFAELGDNIEGKFTIDSMSIIKETDTKINIRIGYGKAGDPLGPKTSSKMFSLVLNNNSGGLTCLGVEDLSNFESKFAQLCQDLLGGVVDVNGECRCADGTYLTGDQVIASGGCQDAYPIVQDEVQTEIGTHYTNVVDPRLTGHDNWIMSHTPIINANNARSLANQTWINTNDPIVSANQSRSTNNQQWINSNSPIVSSNQTRSQNNKTLVDRMSSANCGSRMLVGFNNGNPRCADPPEGGEGGGSSTTNNNNSGPDINVGNASCPPGQYLSGFSASGNTISAQCSSMDMSCPSGQVLTGISNGSPVCEENRSIASTGTGGSGSGSGGGSSGPTCQPIGGSCSSRSDCCSVSCPEGDSYTPYCTSGQCSNTTYTSGGAPTAIMCQSTQPPSGPSGPGGPGPSLGGP